MMETIDKAAGFAHEAVDTIADAAEVFGDSREQLDNAERQMKNDFRDYIHDNPITSAAIAVAAGFFLSRLLSNH
ncbi:MAG: glycine zipper domain-containing protein [Methylobacter sp.]